MPSFFSSLLFVALSIAATPSIFAPHSRIPSPVPPLDVRFVIHMWDRLAPAAPVVRRAHDRGDPPVLAVSLA